MGSEFRWSIKWDLKNITKFDKILGTGTVLKINSFSHVSKELSVDIALPRLGRLMNLSYGAPISGFKKFNCIRLYYPNDINQIII